MESIGTILLTRLCALVLAMGILVFCWVMLGGRPAPGLSRKQALQRSAGGALVAGLILLLLFIFSRR